MKFLLLYWLFLKASMLSFGGLASLPIVRQDLVVTHHMLTDRELNAAVAAARVTPGPLGLYIVSVGYFAGGIEGATAGCLGMITPAFLMVVILKLLGHRAEHRVVKRITRAVTYSAAGLILAVNYPLARDALIDYRTWMLAVGAFGVLLATRLGTLGVMLGAGLLSWLSSVVQK